MISKNVKNSPTVIILFLVALAGVIVSLSLSYEDYISSYMGYISLPTRKANEWIFWVAALVPQLGQIIFGYSFLHERKPWKMTIVTFLHFADVGTDVYFKAHGMNITTWLIALGESEILFTLGSEVLLITAFSMAIDTFPSFVSQGSKVINMLIDAGNDSGGNNGGKPQGGNDNRNNGNNNNQQKHNPQSQPQNRHERDHKTPDGFHPIPESRLMGRTERQRQSEIHHRS